MQVFCYITVKQVISGRVRLLACRLQIVRAILRAKLEPSPGTEKHDFVTVTADGFASPSTESHLQANGMDCL